MGPANDLPSLSVPELSKIDLKGKIVLPAFTDAHLHLIPTALKMDQLDLEPCFSPAEVLNLLSKLPPKKTDEWILGCGFDPNAWGNCSYNRQMLDQLFPLNPVALASKDLHSLWVNTAALEKAGVFRGSYNIEGGWIERDGNDKLTGILKENACAAVYKKFNEVSPDRMNYLLNLVANHLYQYGITSVNAIEELETWRQLESLNQEKSLPLRITCHLPQKHLVEIIESGLKSGSGDQDLLIGGIKFFTDGSLGSQTAHLFESYPGQTGYNGISTIEEDELTEKIILAAQNGLSSVVHAIGNKANHKSLNALGKAARWQKQFKLRQRIEHAQLINRDDLARFRELNLIASMQPVHIADDIPLAEKYWGKLCDNAFMINSLVEQEVQVVFGSDAPVSEPNPFHGIFSAVERKFRLNPANKSWHPEQGISVSRAVKAYTSDASYASYNEENVGSLKPGMLADLIVLDKNIFEVSSVEILNTRVVLTMKNGRIVYSKDNTLD